MLTTTFHRFLLVAVLLSMSILVESLSLPSQDEVDAMRAAGRSEPEIYAYLQSRTSSSPAGLLAARHATPSYPLAASDDNDEAAEITSYVSAYLASHLPSVHHHNSNDNDNDNANRARHRSHRRAAAPAFPAALDWRSQRPNRRATTESGARAASLAAKVRAFVAGWTSEHAGVAAGARAAERLLARAVAREGEEAALPVLRPRGARHWTA
ncbi:hypothetical protein B0A49_11628 [Cryomyces minteri]|uniref:Uncharacterized protein n=1 Tax=Cryomyces minteri TaxID=331657 RepID=A0A4U0W1P5_9PEZI|nr:hypothetical protein B0A49_11628 [Cryomyces minteri]